MVVVLIKLRINLVAVPALSRVLPVTNSGPVTATMGWSATSTTAESGLHVMQAVRSPAFRAAFSPPTT